MASDYLDELEANLLLAVKCLESERFYSFSHGLYELLRHAKHADRLMNYTIAGVSGVSYEKSKAELDRATAANDWYRHE